MMVCPVCYVRVLPTAKGTCPDCGAQIVTALQSIVSRNIDPLQPGVVTVSEFHGGTAHNVIPETVKLTMSVRVFDGATHEILKRRIHEIINGVASSLECSAKIDYVHEHKATVNNAEIAQVVREEAIAIVGADNVHALQKSMGAEDFAVFLQEAPGLMIRLGMGADSPLLHTPEFSFNDEAVPTGMLALAAMVLRICGRKAVQP